MKRYEIGNGSCWMDEDDNGSYVSYADHLEEVEHCIMLKEDEILSLKSERLTFLSGLAVWRSVVKEEKIQQVAEIVALKERVKELETRCEQRTEAAANTLTINRQLRDSIIKMEAVNAKYKSALEKIDVCKGEECAVCEDRDIPMQACDLVNIAREALKEP